MADRVGLGAGTPDVALLAACGPGTIIEPGVRIFGPDRVRLGGGVYIGHGSFLRAYPQGPLVIGDGCWIGPGCFINSYGGVRLGRRVGLGPGVKIISSAHRGGDSLTAIIDTPLDAGEVVVEDGADIGAGAVLLPGVSVGSRAQVGAGTVVTKDVEPGDVVAGVPARSIRRPG